VSTHSLVKDYFKAPSSALTMAQGLPSQTELRESLGEILARLFLAKQRREGKGFTKDKLSTSVVSSKQYFGMIAKGKNRPSYAALTGFLEKLDATPTQRRQARVLLAASQVEDDELRAELASLTASKVRSLHPRSRTSLILYATEDELADPQFTSTWNRVVEMYRERNQNERWKSFLDLLNLVDRQAGRSTSPPSGEGRRQVTNPDK